MDSSFFRKQDLHMLIISISNLKLEVLYKYGLNLNKQSTIYGTKISIIV